MKSLAEVKALLKPHLFIAWVRKQKKNWKFNYMENKNCAIAQYLKAYNTGIESIGGAEFWYKATTMVVIPDGMWKPAVRCNGTKKSLLQELLGYSEHGE